MRTSDTPFPRGWMHCIAIKPIVLAGAPAPVLRFSGAW
jgi:hypothetical protein